MTDKSTTTKTTETDKGLAGTKQKETTETETNKDNAGSNPQPNSEPNQEGGKTDFGGGGRISG